MIDIGLWIGYLLTIFGALAMLGFSIMNIIGNPKNAKFTVIGVGAGECERGACAVLDHGHVARNGSSKAAVRQCAVDVERLHGSRGGRGDES